jgi:hypothetical protein
MGGKTIWYNRCTSQQIKTWDGRTALIFILGLVFFARLGEKHQTKKIKYHAAAG